MECIARTLQASCRGDLVLALSQASHQMVWRQAHCSLQLAGLIGGLQLGDLRCCLAKTSRDWF